MVVQHQDEDQQLQKAVFGFADGHEYQVQLAESVQEQGLEVATVV